VRALTLEVPAGSLADSGSSRGVLAIVAAGAVARLALAAVVPITVDEAYYVDWARHLQPGYLDHPPLVAWLLAVPLRLLGPSAAAVRLPAILLQAGTTLLAASLARALAGGRAAVALALVLQATPVFSLGATLMTPDAPLAFAWAGALWSVERAFRLHRSWFLAAGAFLGLAALSKLTAGLLGLALLAALAATPDGRRALAGPWPWAGAVIALAVASPMLAWNAVHGWPSFAFQLAHGARGRSFSALDLARSIGAQAGYVSPLLLVLAAGAALRALPAPRSPAIAGLAFSAAPVIALFTAAAAFTPGALPHWPAPGWLSACVLLSVAGGRLLRPALVVGFAAIAALLLFLLAPLPLPAGPLDELRGWREGAAAARAAAGDARLAATHWIVLGQIGWYDRASPAYLGERRSGPTFYEPDPRAAGAPLLLVTVEGLDPGREALEARLGPLVPAGGFVATEAERTIRRFRFWRLSPRERG
jgi:4-amino-4-deoxy-L-arabinose transferase-like glycosyltransferase